jgi:hypothetical protein
MAQSRAAAWSDESGRTYPVLGWRRAAPWLTLAAMAALGAALLWDRALADRLTVEFGWVENIQVVCLLAAAVYALRVARARAAGRIPTAPDTGLALLLAGMAAREVDLDRWLLGRRIRISPTLVWPAPRPLIRYALLAIVLLVTAAVAAYCAVRLRQCLAEVARVPVEPWGLLTIAAAVLLLLVEVFERPLSHVSWCPSNFLEETLEMVGSLWLLLAMRARALGARPPDA